MGRKKRFIDKKSSATFHLLARDSSTLPAAASAASSAGDGPAATDRVFVRVDNNPYSVRGLLDEDDGGDEDAYVDDPDSIFADAPADTDDEDGSRPPPWMGLHRTQAEGPLPEHLRREILELGLPDDGYNYLLHLREIKNTGGGSAYYHNSKAKLDRVPLDVKAYDASRVLISSEVGEESKADSIDAVASKTVGVKIQKVVDPDVARLLDDSDLSRFGSDAEDLEEDFVIKANQREGEAEEEDEEEEEAIRGDGKVETGEDVGLEQEKDHVAGNEHEHVGGGEKPRVHRLLDEQFDLLTLREYDSDSDSDDASDTATERTSLAIKLKSALKEYAMDNTELEDNYRVPADYIHGHQETSTDTQIHASADVIRRCAEYAEKYLNDSQDDGEVVVVEESSSESEVWDCETIVSTYSNLDNHPGKIQAPENPKKRLPKKICGDSITKSNVIELRGKEKLPVEYLPHRNKIAEKVKTAIAVSSGTEKPKRRPHGGESKEEKIQRKAAVKEERREARRAKKDLKGLYKCESQRAQKVAAVSGPSSVHLM